jgi:BTB/POZ domain
MKVVTTFLALAGSAAAFSSVKHAPRVTLKIMGANWYDFSSVICKGIMIRMEDIVARQKATPVSDPRAHVHDPIAWLAVTLLQHSNMDQVYVMNAFDLMALVSYEQPVGPTTCVNIVGNYEYYQAGRIQKLAMATESVVQDAKLMVALASTKVCNPTTVFSSPGTWLISSTSYWPLQSMIENLQCISQGDVESILATRLKMEEDVSEEEPDNEDNFSVIQISKADFGTTDANASTFPIESPALVDSTFHDVSFRLADNVVVSCNRGALACASVYFRKCLFGSFKQSSEILLKTFDATTFQIFLEVILSKRIEELKTYLEANREVATQLREMADYFGEAEIVTVSSAALLDWAASSERTETVACCEEQWYKLEWE